MTRSERFFRIVQILRRSRHPVPAKRIAHELETSQRTVYRDVVALVGQGVPISGAPGAGYVLEPGFDMPAMMLTSDELDAALLGASWVASRGDPQLARAAQDLIAKLRAGLPESFAMHIDAPPASIAPVPTIHELVDTAALRKAVRQGLMVQLTYVDLAGRETKRRVWPVLVGYRDSGRILAAWCEERNAFRYFRTDRMKSAVVLETRYPKSPALLRARWREAMDDDRQRYADAAE
ncbi:MAG: helix-turn-helix transcriptional regulator [Polyangiaceae bacterium]